MTVGRLTLAGMFMLSQGFDMFIMRLLLLVKYDCHLSVVPWGENFRLVKGIDYRKVDLSG